MHVCMYIHIHTDGDIGTKYNAPDVRSSCWRRWSFLQLQSWSCEKDLRIHTPMDLRLSRVDTSTCGLLCMKEDCHHRKLFYGKRDSGGMEEPPIF